MGCHREKRSDEAIPMGLEQPLLPPVILITGPTASGKSALALDLAMPTRRVLEQLRQWLAMTEKQRAARTHTPVMHRDKGWLME